MIRVNLIILDENLRRIVGEKEITFKLSENEATIEGLIREAAKRYGNTILETFFKPGNFILLNGQNIEFLGGINAKLSDGDRVSIMPLIAGGFKGKELYFTISIL